MWMGEDFSTIEMVKETDNGVIAWSIRMVWMCCKNE